MPSPIFAAQATWLRGAEAMPRTHPYQWITKKAKGAKKTPVQNRWRRSTLLTNVLHNLAAYLAAVDDLPGTLVAASVGLRPASPDEERTR